MVKVIILNVLCCDSCLHEMVRDQRPLISTPVSSLYTPIVCSSYLEDARKWCLVPVRGSYSNLQWKIEAAAAEDRRVCTY